MQAKKLLVIIVVAGLSSVGSAQKCKWFCKKRKKCDQELVITNGIDSASYAVGMNMAITLQMQGVDSLNNELVSKGFRDYLSSDDSTKFDKETSEKLFREFMQKAVEARLKKNKQAGIKFLTENGKRKEVTTTASGLQYEVLREGNGEKPALSDKVEVHYHGTLTDGTVFDSSVERGKTISFPVTGVIKGWTEVLQLMPVGSKWKVFIPQDLAYGANPRPGGPIQPYMALVFEIDLISIEK